MFELSNKQREYFGLQPVDASWIRVLLKGDKHHPESILYFEGESVRKYVKSTALDYTECQYDEPTRNREILLPKSGKGREKKLTASALESRQPWGVHCRIDVRGRIYIGSYETHTTFYDNGLQEQKANIESNMNERVSQFILSVPPNYLQLLNSFVNAKRQNVKYKAGDFFCFRISLTEYGFGRILLDIYQLRKKSRITSEHGLGFLMGRPVLVKIYAYVSQSKAVNLDELEKVKSLPSDYMFDNLIFYGEFEIIGNKNLSESDFDFPMSYGRHISAYKKSVFFQWGLIHVELPATEFTKYLSAENPALPENYPWRMEDNPYGYYGLGLYPHYLGTEIKKTIENNGDFDFGFSPYYKTHFDLRNPKNSDVREELMRTFGLDPEKNYKENCLLTNTSNPI